MIAGIAATILALILAFCLALLRVICFHVSIHQREAMENRDSRNAMLAILFWLAVGSSAISFALGFIIKGALL